MSYIKGYVDPPTQVLVVVLDEKYRVWRRKITDALRAVSADKLSRKHHGIAARRHEPSNEKSDRSSAQSQPYVSIAELPGELERN